MIGTFVSIIAKVATFLTGIFFAVGHPDITDGLLSFTNLVKNSALGAVDFLGGLA